MKKHGKSPVSRKFFEPLEIIKVHGKLAASKLSSKEQKRIKRLKEEYMKLWEEELERKEAEFNTVRTRNILEQAERLAELAGNLDVQ